MSESKTQKFEVKDFSFGQLVPSNDGPLGEISEFELQSLDQVKEFKNNISQDLIRSEREHAASSGFSIDSRVEEHRGLSKQAQEDYEKAVNAEVEKRFAALKEQAYQEGFAKGQEEGNAQALAESSQKFEEIISDFVGKIDAVNEEIRDVYEKSKEEAYLMVKNLTKWIILKEVDEKYYLVRLLEKLIYEINTKSNLVVRVNEDVFGYMPEVIKIVERKLGKLTNVRMEVDLDQSNNGIKLESENTIVDGSLETQFKSIDKLFENVGINE